MNLHRPLHLVMLSVHHSLANPWIKNQQPTFTEGLGEREVIGDVQPTGHSHRVGTQRNTGAKGEEHRSKSFQVLTYGTSVCLVLFGNSSIKIPDDPKTEACNRHVSGSHKV